MDFLHLPRCTVKTHDSPIDFTRSMDRYRFDGTTASWRIAEAIVGGEKERGEGKGKGRDREEVEGGRSWRSTVEKIYGETGRFIGLRDFDGKFFT